MRDKNKKRWLAVCLAVILAVTGMQSVPVQAATPGKTTVTVMKRGKTTATLKVKKVKNATGYQIFIANSKKGKYRRLGTIVTGQLQVSKLKKNKAYYVKARAYKTVGTRITMGKYSKAIKIDKYSAVNTAEKKANEILELVNRERTKAGLNELKLSQELNAAANVRAKELVEKFEHIRPDGRDCYTVLTDAGIMYSSVGENIASGFTSAKKVMAAWMESDGHRANILSDGYTNLGVGYYRKGNKTYWVQIFTKE